MRVVNVKELKARLSAYLREVKRGETLLVTDRSQVVAKLTPPGEAPEGGAPSPIMVRLLRLGARPPLRERRATDYRRSGPSPALGTAEIDRLLAWVREEPR